MGQPRKINQKGSAKMTSEMREKAKAFIEDAYSQKEITARDYGILIFALEQTELKEYLVYLERYDYQQKCISAEEVHLLEGLNFEDVLLNGFERSYGSEYFGSPALSYLRDRWTHARIVEGEAEEEMYYNFKTYRLTNYKEHSIPPENKVNKLVKPTKYNYGILEK
jgi:hypothetical protein